MGSINEKHNKKFSARIGNRTRPNCLEGNYANQYTMRALKYECAKRTQRSKETLKLKKWKTSQKCRQYWESNPGLEIQSLTC